MEKINVTISRIADVDSKNFKDDYNRYVVSFRETFKGMTAVRDADNKPTKDIKEDDINYINIFTGIFDKFINERIAEVAYIRGVEYKIAKAEAKAEAAIAGIECGEVKNPFNTCDLDYLLKGVVLVIERERHEAGEEYTDGDEVKTYQGVYYETRLIDVVVPDSVQNRLREERQDVRARYRAALR